MEPETPLANSRYLLQKFPGKGGWTYAAIPEVLQDKHSPFGWVRVKGWIDGHEIRNYRLMPMGNGQLFLPVKAAIRKEIGKQEGDWITVILYADHSPAEIPEEFLECLRDEPASFKTFMSFTDGQQKEYLDWIYAAKTEDTRVERIAETLRRLDKKLKFRDKQS